MAHAPDYYGKKTPIWEMMGEVDYGAWLINKHIEELSDSSRLFVGGCG